MGPVSMERSGAGRAIWMALIVVAGAGLSLFYACATPFAALATLAALKTDRRDTALVVGLVWLANQVIGYGFLHYPHDLVSIVWGLAIGVAAGTALLAAIALAPRRPGPFGVSLPFVGAFTAYEFVLYLASFALPTEDGAFALSVVKQIFVVNAVVLVALVLLHWLATAVGLLTTHHPDDDQNHLGSALPAR
ncbi:MAG TPA: hypothetical protein VHB27_18265 [Rhodopila sp.]|uniref:hypothetical protein n=1 Tax=Rhodopila sp. TaxID=2480087 RepID=UPI002B9FD89D|nr:hypothetical protein [Rhodopila sp.]HVY17174.1 hypothetical protein [Rhodopila sp.]